MTPRKTRAGPKPRTQGCTDVNHIHQVGELGSANPRRSDLFQSAPWWEKKEQHIDCFSLREQLIEKDQHIARLQDMLRAEREKVRSSQQEAELRRCEQLRDRLKEHLHPHRHREMGRPSIEVLNLVRGYGGEEERGNKSDGFTTQQEVTALRVMLERREAELREALKLRHSTTTLLHALRGHMEQTLQDLHPQEALRNRLNQLVQAEADLGDHVTGGVIRSWLTVQKRLGLFFFEGHSVVGTDQDRLAELETELEESQDLVKHQQQLLQDGLFSPVPPHLADCYFLEEWDRLQARWAELRLQRRNFERERQSFTNAAIRLSHQQRDFDQEKATLLKQQFLGDSLFFKVSHGSDGRESTALDFSVLEPLSIPCDRSASPSSTESASSVEAGSGPRQRRKRVSARTPSTPELYSALHLPYECGGEGDCRSENCLESIQRTHLQHLDCSI